MTLNAAQQKAVTAVDGPVVIIAGPGTGKTKTLVARIRHLLQTVPAHTILALTFTKKAATEMRDRLGESNVWIGTFHALCHELLGGEHVFATEPQRLSIIKSLHRPAALRHATVREVGLAISRAKNTNQMLDIVKAYDQALAQLGLIDFDDLLIKTKELLQTNPARRAQVQRRFTHILVDEFQDTNNLQYELLQLMRGTDNLFVIGDPLQSIYGFRGASGDIFETFATDFPAALRITLGINYRSAPHIVRLSNALFGGTLSPHSKQPGQVQAVKVLNEYSEAAWVVGHIQQALGGDDLLRAVSTDTRGDHKTLADFAVLYRSRAVSFALVRALETTGLPYQIVGDGSPYEAPQVQALITLLGMCAGATAQPVRGFSGLQTQALVQHVDQALPPAELAEALIAACGFEKSAALQAFVSGLVRFESVSHAVAHLQTLASQNFYDPAADAITLLTIHAAKGLEFNHVFLLAAEEGALPHAKAEPAEEKRLFYVAATRAKQGLTILHATKRGGQPAQVSHFVAELSDAILPKLTDPNLNSDQRRAQKRHAKRAQASLF